LLISVFIQKEAKKSQKNRKKPNEIFSIQTKSKEAKIEKFGSFNAKLATLPGVLAISPPPGKKNCAKAPPLGKKIGSIPPGNNVHFLVQVDLHVIILWTI
jgi:hypothetical protein